MRASTSRLSQDLLRPTTSLARARPLVRTTSTVPAFQQQRQRSSVAYDGHVPLNFFEQGLLTVGSGLMSLIDPHRHDMVATFGETTAGRALPRLRDAMLQSESGLQILKDRPRLTTQTIDMATLQKLPENTFGRAYTDWLAWCKVTPDTRDPVRFIDDPELAYVMQRYRECHDFYHVITGFPVSMSGEIVVKWFETANTGLPMTALAALGGPIRLSSAGRRRLLSTYVPWALRCGSTAKPLIGVYWEKLWEKDFEELKKELGIYAPPVAWRDFKKGGPWK